MSTPLPRSEFAVTQRYAYLNHAAVGVLPQTTLERLEQHLRAHATGGVLGTFPYEQRMAEFRARIGSLIGARGRDVAVVPNTNAGATVLAQGVAWRQDDEVLLCDNEFPANAVPWLALRARGVRVRELDTSQGRLTPDRLRREIGKQTRAIALSWVSYADGYRHDLGALAEIAHAAGAWLFVDAIQGLGAFPIDVRALGVDALFAGGAKWLLALQGVGLLYVGEELLDRLNVALPGWRSVADMWDFHNHAQPYVDDASRFEAGTPSFLGALSMASSIELLERADPDRIGSHVLELTDRLVEGLSRCGAEIVSLRAPGCASGIVLFRVPGVASVALGRALQAHGVVTTWRANGIRVAPHGYNTAAEIDRLLEALPECAAALASNPS